MAVGRPGDIVLAADRRQVEVPGGEHALLLRFHVEHPDLVGVAQERQQLAVRRKTRRVIARSRW